jgi:hypothetical protein
VRKFRVLDKQTRYVERISHKPLDPPRDVKYLGGVVSWSPPQETRNVTHFRIYKDNEYQLIRQVPLGQTELRDRIVADRLFVSCYNSSTKRESRKVLLGEAVFEGFPHAIVFGIPGSVVVGEDVCPHVEIAVGTGKEIRCLRGYVNAKDEPTTALKIDMEYSTDDSTVSYEDRTWSGLFPTTTGDLILPGGQMQMDSPADPMALPDRTLVRCNVREGDGGAAVSQIRCVIKEAD